MFLGPKNRFAAPVGPLRHVPRPRLTDVLDATTAPLTLLAAGPGAGKEVHESVEVVRGPAETGEAPARSGGEAVVLGCDLEVRERLRFMVWMQRVRAERRAAAFETSAGH